MNPSQKKQGRFHIYICILFLNKSYYISSFLCETKKFKNLSLPTLFFLQILTPLALENWPDKFDFVIFLWLEGWSDWDT